MADAGRGNPVWGTGNRSTALGWSGANVALPTLLPHATPGWCLHPRYVNSSGVPLVGNTFERRHIASQPKPIQDCHSER